MNKILFLTALWIAKTLNFLIVVFRFGQGSNFPGKVALTIHKNIIKCFKFKRKDKKIILITGTNGKSTTTRFVASILNMMGKKVVFNKSGANLITGIINTLCFYSDLFGNLNQEYFLFEVDEATLKLITSSIQSNVIAVTNFFRDQLDRFGELDKTVSLIEEGIKNNKDSVLVLNADDVRVASLNVSNQKIFFGLGDDRERKEKNTDSISALWSAEPEEMTICPSCKSELIFDSKFVGHLGNYKCKKCNFKRPEIKYKISSFKMDNMTTNLDIYLKNKRVNFFLPTIGIFNLYNAVSAISIVQEIAEPTNLQIQKGLNSFSTIFGRGEKVKLSNKSVWIYLIKNPTGATEVLKTLLELPDSRFLIAINDNFADGRDISWLWDTKFDLLKNQNKQIFVSGNRAYDMALRLKHSDIPENLISVNEDISECVSMAVKSLVNKESLYILPTYTVLLEMQKKGLCKSEKL